MPTTKTLAWSLCTLSLLACSPREERMDASGDQSSPVTDGASPTPDAATEDSATVTPDGGAVPFITEALTCRFAPPVGPGGGTMQKHTVDTTRFPDALCNDGTAAVLHFRPYRGAANRNKWVISLRGGGFCGTGDSCAARYCGCSNARAAQCPSVPMEERTNFDAGNMTNAAPNTMIGDGIFLRDGGPTMVNPIQDYNQVRLQYCSSDVWSGTRRDVVLSAVHPVTGAAIQYRIHFLGRRILDADIATLRRDGTAPLVHMVGGTSTEMPDLDDAEEVIFTGDSAGGAGIIYNLDRLESELRTTNTRCTGGACPLRVRGLIDAQPGPERGRLDWSGTRFMTYQNYLAARDAGQRANLGTETDQSCVEWHRSRAPGSETICADDGHVLRHHITTPFFVRMALADALISSNYTAEATRDPTLGPMSPLVFAQILAREFPAFPMLPMTAEEGAMMTVAPGVFAPGCLKHDTIFDNDEVYRSSVTPAGGSETRLFDVFEPWRASGTSRAVVATSRMDTFCP